MATEIDIAVTTTTYDVTITAEPNEYVVNIITNSGGAGIESVTGTTVDNTDPLNPIVEIPTLQQVTDEGNTTTNDIIVRHSTDNEVIISSITDNSQISVNQGTAGVVLAAQKVGGISEALIQMTSDKGLNIITEGAIQLSNSDNNTTIDLNDSGLSMVTLGVNQRINLSNGVDDVSIKTDLIDGSYEQQLPPKDGTFAFLDDVPTKTSDLINDGDNGISHFITLEDLPSNLILYPTTTASGIGSYNKLVSSITDPYYNSTAVDVSTGAITGTDQFIAGLITSPNIIVGNPGIFNITTIGNIRKVSGAGQAEFYFRVYKRDSGGTETLILQSSNTPQITSAIYTEFSATGLWNDGVFISTDMIVMKFYGTKVGSGSSPTYDFQFGGTQPVRTLVPIPLTVVPNLSLDELTDVTISAATNNQVLSYTSATDIWENKTIIQDSITDGVTTVAPSQNAVFDALELRKRRIINDTTSVTVTGTTALTLVKTFELTTGTLPISGILDLFMYSTRTVVSGIHTMGLYINTTNNFATATLIGNATTGGNFTPILSFKASYTLKNNLLMGGNYSALSGTNYIPTATLVSVACNNTSASVWLFVGVTPSASGQIVEFQSIEIVI